jgi:hypothetical protein
VVGRALGELSTIAGWYARERLTGTKVHGRHVS